MADTEGGGQQPFFVEEMLAAAIGQGLRQLIHDDIFKLAVGWLGLSSVPLEPRSEEFKCKWLPDLPSPASADPVPFIAGK